MKKSLITLIITLLTMAAQAQIKMHSNGFITFQTVANTTAQGIVFGPAPNWNVDFNGPVYFHRTIFSMKNASNYDFMAQTKAANNYSVAWAVTLASWDNTKFYVYGNGQTYATHYYTISSSGSSKGAEAIDGGEALSIITGIKGYYYEPENQETPSLEGNEFVAPEAVEAMYADFSKRTAGLSGSNLEDVFPAAVRTDPQNRLCIDYQSVVTMLVEAVKEQQHEIEELRTALKKVENNK